MTLPRLGRRPVLLGAAAIGLGCAPRGARSGASLPLACILSPEQVEGPYYLDGAKLRRDLREDRRGVSLELALTVLDARTCRPVESAAIDVWHCDAEGAYSGFGSTDPGGPFPGPRPGFPPPDRDGHPHEPPPRPERRDALTFLRGVELTDSAGQVRFATVYPGFYAGRAVHIHVRVRTEGTLAGATYRGGHVAHTGQLFFPEDVSDRVFALAPYARSETRVLQKDDPIFGRSGAAGLLTLSSASEPYAGYSGALTMAIDPTATPPRIF